MSNLQEWNKIIKKYLNGRYIVNAKKKYNNLLKEEARLRELEEIKKLAKDGDVKYIRKLADMYYYGVYTEKNRKLAYEWYKLLADKNDLEAIIIMAHIYIWNNSRCKFKKSI